MANEVKTTDALENNTIIRELYSAAKERVGIS